MQNMQQHLDPHLLWAKCKYYFLNMIIKQVWGSNQLPPGTQYKPKCIPNSVILLDWSKSCFQKHTPENNARMAHTTWLPWAVNMYLLCSTQYILCAMNYLPCQDDCYYTAGLKPNTHNFHGRWIVIRIRSAHLCINPRANGWGPWQWDLWSYYTNSVSIANRAGAKCSNSIALQCAYNLGIVQRHNADRLMTAA